MWRELHMSGPSLSLVTVSATIVKWTYILMYLHILSLMQNVADDTEMIRKHFVQRITELNDKVVTMATAISLHMVVIDHLWFSC